MLPTIELYHMTRISYKGRPCLVWVRDPVPLMPQAAYSVMQREHFQRAASGRAADIHSSVMHYMMANNLHVYIFERGPVQTLATDDVRIITQRAQAGEYSQGGNL